MTRRSALVTGAASGIGAEVAARLRDRGYRVIAVDRTATLAGDAARALGGESIGIECDLSDAADVARLCDRVRGDWSAELEVLVCNAGVIVPGDVVDLEPSAVDVQLGVMLASPIRLMQSALPAFIDRDRGHLLATVSIGGIIALPGSAVYSAAKSGLRAFLAALHAELHSTNVKVSGIYPSAVDTPMLRHEAVSGGSALNFLGSVLTVDDVADAFERALDSGKLEIYLPYTDSLSTRAISLRPAALPRLLPLFDRLGERGRARFIAEHRLDRPDPT